jgi:hypothetical protein
MPENTWDSDKFKRRGLYPPMVPQVEMPRRNQPSLNRGNVNPQGAGNSLITAPLPGGLRIQDFEDTPDPSRVVMPFKVAFKEPLSPIPQGVGPNNPVTPTNRQETPNHLWDRIGQKQGGEEDISSNPSSYWSQYNSKPTVPDTSISENYVAPASNNPASQSECSSVEGH